MSKKPKVLMYGWEFPPHNSGGLGTACYGLTQALSKLGAQITFVLPYLKKEFRHRFIKITSPEKEKVKTSFKKVGISSPLVGYMTSQEYKEFITEEKSLRKKHVNLYGPNLFTEVERYADEASQIASTEKHDVIHAHDWLTFKAGIKAKKISKKPLIIHVHATEYDRTGGHGVNQHVYQIEKQGMEHADHIVAVSNFTKNKIIQHYHIPPEKITVVHNAVDFTSHPVGKGFKISQKDKTILFLGRITIQKGPDWFVELAKKILDFDQNFKFIIVGSGDMEGKIIKKVAELHLGHKVLFAGFLRGPELDQIYQMADLYVMPSISEPFGITPLEAMRNQTPCLISKQSGVSEVIHHCLKADFWDIERMADQIISIFKYQEGYQHLKNSAIKEIQKFNWENPAQKCLELYQKMRGEKW